MRRLGLLGGMSWESTALYYRLLNEGAQQRLGGLASADLVVRSLDFAAVERLQTAGRWDDAGVLLAQAAVDLERAGSELLLLCTNTMHRVFDAVQGAVEVPVLHLADATAAAAVARGQRRVLLLGTAFTMEQSFYRDRLLDAGLDVVVPGPPTRALVHRTIYDELCRGVVSDASRAAVVEAVATEPAVDAVVLGCTELELLLDEDDLGVPVLATTRLHVAAALEAAFAPL